MADAVLPTLASLVAAPAASALSDVDPGLVVDLLVRLTDASSLFPSARNKAAVDEGDGYKSTVSSYSLSLFGAFDLRWNAVTGAFKLTFLLHLPSGAL